MLVFFICDLMWYPFRNAIPEMQALALFYIMPKIFWDLNNIAVLHLVVGFGLWLFRWRSGNIELTDDKLIIDGSYPVIIKVVNMWEVDIRDFKYERFRIRLDSKTDAVQLKFRTEKEFETFSLRLIELAGNVDNIKMKNNAYI